MKKLDTYYNNQQKLNFLAGLNVQDISYYKRIFRMSYSIETEKDKDLAFFTAEEVIDMYRRNDIRSLMSIRKLHILLKEYVRTYNPEGDFNIGVINDSILKQSLNTVVVRNKYVLERDIDEWENTLRNRDDWNAVDMFIIRAIYEGICGAGFNELLPLRFEDIYKKDGKNYVDINVDYPKTIEVSDKLYRLALESSKEYTYKVTKYHFKSKSDIIYKVPLIGDKIIKIADIQGKSEGNTVNKLNRRFGRVREILGIPYISYKDINKSGVCNRLKRIAESKGLNTTDYMADLSNEGQIRSVLREYGINNRESYYSIRRDIEVFLDNE